MLKPLLPNIRKQALARSNTRPPPIGGWNARDAEDLMEPTDAVWLDNLFPTTSRVRLRGGSIALSTSAMAGAVETLKTFKAGSVNKLIAAGGGSVYDASGATPSSLGSGYTNNEWSMHVFNGYVFGFNGTDTPWKYDGTTFGATGITGPTLADIKGVSSHGNRLYLIQKESLSFWYGGVDAVAGAFTEFDLSTEVSDGGHLNSMAVISTDGGVNSNDVAVFFIDNGEVVLYSGTNPGDATNWSRVGSFKLAQPFTERNSVQIGSDLACITKDGVVPIAQVIPLGRARSERANFSDKIKGAFRDAARNYASLVGWDILTFDPESMLVVNVPINTTLSHQYVMNLQTNSWCRFKDLNGFSWAVYNDKLYFGKQDGKVYQAEEGTDDSGSPIQFFGKTAWDYHDQRGANKLFHLARPILNSDTNVSFQISLETDFAPHNVQHAVEAPSPVQGAIWDSAIWDSAIWSSGDAGTVKKWIGASNLGYCSSLEFRGSSSQQISWDSTSYIYTFAGLI